MWAIDRNQLQTQRYRVISVTENENFTFNVTAVEHIASKFDATDKNVPIDIPNTTWTPPNTQAGLTNVKLSHYESAAFVTTSLVVTGSWDKAPNAISYEVEYKRDGNPWVLLPRTAATTIDIRDAWAGVYYIRVRAINQAGLISNAVMSQAYVVGEQTRPPGFVNDIVDDLIEHLDQLPNVVTKEELVEITQHMMLLGTASYEEALYRRKPNTMSPVRCYSSTQSTPRLCALRLASQMHRKR
ncbi:tail protein [Xanthomonas phage JGB6]|nr:tail protein [Xanthomonas phage JGB6]